MTQQELEDILNAITPQGFIDWVAKQSGPYNYTNPQDCAFARYIMTLGIENPSVSHSDITIPHDAGWLSHCTPLLSSLDWISMGFGSEESWTFELLHQRLLKEFA